MVGWQTAVVPILLAGDVRIDSTGIKVYQGAPGASPVLLSLDQFGNIKIFNSGGQVIMQMSQAFDAFLLYADAGPATQGALLASQAGKAGTDGFGNAYVQGAAAYVTLGVDKVALRLGSGSFAGTPAAAFFTHDQNSPANSDPMAGAVAASSAGCSMVLYSGNSTALAGGAGIQASDSVFSGVTGGEVSIVAGKTILVSGGGAIPLTDPVITTLPTDNNSGSTWVSGERAFMNNSWVTNINNNFSNIITTLRNAGIIQ